MKKIIFILIMISMIFAVSSCEKKTADDTQLQNTQIANPASEYCIKQGGNLEIQDTEQGQVGMCTLKDGTICEEWAYFRKECP